MSASGASARASVGAERFARVALALEAAQAQTVGWRLRGQQHVQLGEPRGVGEELRVRLRPLAAVRDMLAARERIRHPCWPVVKRRCAEPLSR